MTPSESRRSSDGVSGTPSWFGTVVLGECVSHGPHTEPQCPECRRDPSRHCFREDSLTFGCCDCGHPAAAHTGCDCEPSTCNVCGNGGGCPPGGCGDVDCPNGLWAGDDE